MTIVVERIKRLRFVQEVGVSNFGVEQPIANFFDIAYREDSLKMTLNRPMDTPMLVQQRLDGYPSKVFLPKDAQLDFASNLRAATARAGNAVTASAGAGDGPLWEVALGGRFAGTGTTISTTSTTSVLNLTSATGMREGGALACATGAGGALECREIKTVSGSVVTLKYALSSIPANGSTVYGCNTVYLGNSDGTSPQSIQFAVEGLLTTDRWLLKGGQSKASPQLEAAPGTVPKVTWSWGTVGWLPADGVSTTMNLNTPLVDAAYQDSGINAVMDSEFRMFTVGTTPITNTLIDASEIKIAPNVKYVPVKTPSGLNTVKQWVRARPDGPAATGEFVLPYEDMTWFTTRDAETEKAVSYQIGSSVANGCVLVSVPRVSIDDVQREEVDGIAGQRVKWYAKLDNQTTTNSNDLQQSPFRIHFF